MKKLFSRKFLVSLGAILATGITAQPSIGPYLIVGIAIVYVIAEAILDRLGIPTVNVENLLPSSAGALPMTINVTAGPDSKPEEIAAAVARSLAPMSAAPPTEASTTSSSAAAAASMLTGIWLLHFFGAVIAVVCLAGCSPAAKEKPACSHMKLAEIEAAYTAAIVKQCKGESFESCGARPAIEAQNAAHREEWARCQ